MSDPKPTSGGINVFSYSVGLNGGLPDTDLNPIPGREMVLIVCEPCGAAIIGKVLVHRDLVWLNHFSPPKTDDLSTRRPPGSARIPAPRVVVTERLERTLHPERLLWCEKHGERTLVLQSIYVAIQRAEARGKPVRLAV